MNDCPEFAERTEIPRQLQDAEMTYFPMQEDILFTQNIGKVFII